MVDDSVDPLPGRQYRSNVVGADDPVDPLPGRQYRSNVVGADRLCDNPVCYSLKKVTQT